ncbi:hypothetical protein ACFVXH_30750 [Kitasatospora sp. NPDC058184]|uniref:hypothetical protein n=1 Tax=Kitasatospora sp. NPDC058184 TaxID=3346370 RepID=UPI0036DB7BA6
MTGIHLSTESIPEFLGRFLGFEDGVISGIFIVLPRGNEAGRTIMVEVQAMDRTDPGGRGAAGGLFGWKLVRIVMHGINEYRLAETRAYPLQVLSDGLKVGSVDGFFVLDLDPGPDEWSARAIRDESNSYSKQYVVSRLCSFEVLDGPFI